MSINIITWAFLFFTIFDVLEANTTDVLRQTLPIYSIAIKSNILTNISACKSELDLFRNGVDNKKLWSLKILDANGEPKPGFIYGNRFWLGNRNQCFDIGNRKPIQMNHILSKNNSKSRNAVDEFPPFDVNYFVAHFRHNSTIQYHIGFPNEDIISLALCLPASCTVNELSTILENIFQERTLTVGNLYDADFSLIHISNLKSNHQWLINWRVISVGFIIILTWLLMILGTGYDLFIRQKRPKMKQAVGINRTTEFRNYSYINKLNLFSEIILCFSVYTNAKFIFQIKHSPDSIPVIHGLRFLGMVWIIMIHSVLFMSDYVDNRVWSMRMSEGVSSQVISNGTLSVDTFFVISGFLLAWIFFKDRKKKSNDARIINYIKWQDFFGGIVRRFIRLTPTYIIILGIAEINFNWHNQTSLFYMSEKPQDTCAKYWWRNLLYINNFFGREQMCLSWSWYLSDDMQFFIIGLFLLVLSDKYFYTSATLLIILLVFSTVITGFTSYLYEYTPTLDVQWDMLDIFYYSPWMRIGPYLIGMITAFILTRMRSKLKFSKKILCLLWILGISCNFSTLFGLYGRDLSITTTAIYIALSRTVWGIGISWLIIACCSHNGGIVNKILTMNLWVPFSKLTYCAYLINPLIINSIYLFSEISIHIEFLPNVIIFLGELAITYICACVIALMAEIPYSLMIKLLINPRRSVK